MGLLDSARAAERARLAKRLQEMVGPPEVWEGDRWQYKVISLRLGSDDAQVALDAMGDAGWELVAINEGVLVGGGTGASTGVVKATFKRLRLRA